MSRSRVHRRSKPPRGGKNILGNVASYRQRITHFTEELSFLSESDKDLVMGRAIVQRLKWT
jgi:hypothetical protein